MENKYVKQFECPTVTKHNEGWMNRHLAAVLTPRNGIESALVQMFSGWLKYADEHNRYETGIGSDYVLGVEWAKIGGALLGLLNGETGRLDCGTLDSLIRNVLSAEGIDPENV
jgi:hypothetical protein